MDLARQIEANRAEEAYDLAKANGLKAYLVYATLKGELKRKPWILKLFSLKLRKEIKIAENEMKENMKKVRATYTHMRKSKEKSQK